LDSNSSNVDFFQTHDLLQAIEEADEIDLDDDTENAI
jgi:hypothetical protein